MKLQNPTPEAIRAVADTLDAAAAAEKEAGRDLRIRMWAGAATRTPRETACCHGGAYFLLAISERQWGKDPIMPPDFQSRFYGQAFIHGAGAMAHDLGFRDIWELTHWAFQNPDLWGNKSGDSMFTSPFAFHQTPDTISIGAIADWWRAVADRIETADARKVLAHG